MGDYWDSFDCQIQCEEIYHEEDFFNEDEDEYYDDEDDCFEPGRPIIDIFALNP